MATRKTKGRWQKVRLHVDWVTRHYMLGSLRLTPENCKHVDIRHNDGTIQKNVKVHWGKHSANDSDHGHDNHFWYDYPVVYLKVPWLVSRTRVCLEKLTIKVVPEKSKTKKAEKKPSVTVNNVYQEIEQSISEGVGNSPWDFSYSKDYTNFTITFKETGKKFKIIVKEV